MLPNHAVREVTEGGEGDQRTSLRTSRSLSLLPPLRTSQSCVSGKRDYFCSSSLFGGWSNKRTVSGTNVTPLPNMFYAIQCINQKERNKRGDLYMVLYDSLGGAGNRQGCILSKPSAKNVPNESIKLIDKQWSLVCVQCSTLDRIWFSTLEQGAKWSKFHPESSLDDQTFWIPVNIYFPKIFVPTTVSFKRVATLQDGVLQGSTEGVSKAWFLNPIKETKKCPPPATPPVVEGKKKKRKRKNCKGYVRSTHVQSTLPLPCDVVTIYYKSSQASPLAPYITSNSSCVIFPAPELTGPVTVNEGVSFQERKYYVILKENIDTVHDFFSKRRVLQYSKYHQLLQKYSQSTFYMLEVIACDVSVRFVVTTDEEYNALSDITEVTAYSCQHFRIETSCVPNILLSGVTVSMWSGSDQTYTKDHTFSVKDVRRIVNIYGKGYGSRLRSFCEGLCVFNCPDKTSQMANPDPFQSDMQNCAYYRANYSHLDKRPEMEELLRKQAVCVMEFSKVCFSTQFSLLFLSLFSWIVSCFPSWLLTCILTWFVFLIGFLLGSLLGCP